MNPLQLEQIMMMMSSFTSGSIFRRTGCLPREYPYTPRPIHPKKASSTEKKHIDAPALHTHRNVLGTL